MSDDELRAKITKVLTVHSVRDLGYGGHVLCQCEKTDWMSWSKYRRHQADALLPVVREALADARFRATCRPTTPWREDT